MTNTSAEPRGEPQQSTEPNETTENDETNATSPRECHETVDSTTRDEVLETYQHRCQTCGRRGPAKGGLATLHVHHIERDPDGLNEHDMGNLTLLCRSCHSWLHQQSTPDDSPVRITDADQSVLLPQDIEILRVLAEMGPARTGDIASGVPTERSVPAVRQRLWVLMGLDNIVDSRDTQIVDKDTETGEWGLTEQIENSARGHIPDDPQLLFRRMEDEQARQALERGCDRQEVVNVLEVSRRTTFNKVKRAHAFDFPLDAFKKDGQPTDSDRSESDTTETPPDNEDQQRLDTVADQPSPADQPDARDYTETRSANADGGNPDDTTDTDVSAQLAHALAALQEVHKAL